MSNKPKGIEFGIEEKQGFAKGIEAVIDYLENEIKTVDKRTAGLRTLKVAEVLTLKTVVYALKEWQGLKREK